jgi:hypothetical protein
MTDEPNTPGDRTPHIAESLDPCKCPHCGSYATEKVEDACPTVYDGIPAANERWRCRRCRRDYLALYEGHVHALLWVDARGDAGFLLLNEDSKRRNATELYERLAALSTWALTMDSRRRAGIAASGEDWSMLSDMATGAHRLITRIKEQTLG